MKKIAILMAFAALTLGATSCNDYLDKVPLDKNSDVTNWTSEASLESFAWSMYGNFLGYGNGGSRGDFLNTGMSDNVLTDGFSQPTQNLPATSSGWNNRYTEIRKTNILLNRIELVPNLSEEAANHWRGVARFFRGMKHYQLVATYGDVIWVDSEINIDDSEALSRSRDPRLTVMKNVCEDLQFAADNCRNTTNNTVNSDVANALLARVALFEAAWQKYHENNNGEAKALYEIAKKASSAIISSGRYSIHDKYLSNYISKDLNGNKEMILYKVYCATAEGAKVQKTHGTQGWSCSSSKSNSLTKSGVESFVMSNGLPIHMGNYDDSSIEKIVTDRDARLSLIIDPEVICPVGWSWKEGINSTTGYNTDKFVDWNDYGTTTWLSPANTSDSPIYGYAEVLMNYAEACAEIEDLGGANMTQADLDKSVNVTRAKHGNLPALTYAGKGKVSVNGTAITKDPKNDTGISELLWEVRRERRNELMCDGFRYEDLRRWKLGRYLDYAKNIECILGASLKAIDAYVAATKGLDQYDGAKYSEIIDGNFWIDGYMTSINTAKNVRVFDENKNYLEPIPSNEITLNPNLTQNPGW